ncbi:MAG: HPr(Ser) kinase/phosphatase [candidate division Zixibacteria bacterium]|nr:HPr(Ser) kinase/phosphatase [candidate division Zixibacteria bacterium]
MHPSTDSITVEQLINERRDYFELTVFTPGCGLDNSIVNNQVHRPGLALSGFTERFAHKRSQILGETEHTYMKSLSSERLKAVLRQLFSFNVPVLIITKGNLPPKELIETAMETNTAVLGTRLNTLEFTYRYSAFLDYVFAPRTSIHGTLVDVYGVGLLYTGRSGIGKSECALDLVERGHRLVADDIVQIRRKSPTLIMGSGTEMLGHHMEVRGIGIINIERLFGIRSIRMQKRIEVLVRLEIWDEKAQYERLGIEDKFTSILGVEVPMVKIPVSPGKNITVISEVIAMNHMLRVYGQNPALELSRRLTDEIERKQRTTGYLEADIE